MSDVLLNNDDFFLKEKDDLRDKIFNVLPKHLSHNIVGFDVELFIRLIYEKWITDDFDCLIAITGEKGTGKSSLSLRVAIEYYKLYFPDKKFNMITNIFYESDANEIFEKLKRIPNGDVAIFDESSRIILAEEWNKTGNRMLKKIFAEIRTKHLIIIFSLPFQFANIDAKYRNSLFKFWIILFNRDFGVILQKNIAPIGDAWGLEWFKKEMKFLGISSDNISEIDKKITKHPCFYHRITWKKLSDSVYAAYLKIRDDFVYNHDSEFKRNPEQQISKSDLKIQSKLKDNLKETIINLRKRNYSISDIASITKIKKDEVAEITKDIPVAQSQPKYLLTPKYF